MVRRVLNRRALGTVCLAIGTFLNPLGFDVLVYKLMQLMKDYWTTMLLLYACAALFFGLSYLYFKIGKRITGNVMLTLGFFVNPFGYDLVVYAINLLTGSYWVTMGIMYVLAALFFGIFAYLYNVNIVSTLRYHITKLYNNSKNVLKNEKSIR